MTQTINIEKRFKDEVCTFAAAKRAKAAGMTCANTFFAYDRRGEISDGGWLEKLGFFQEYYPCINFAFACAMLNECDFDKAQFTVTSLVKNGRTLYTISYKKDEFTDANIVDVMVDFWAKYKRK